MYTIVNVMHWYPQVHKWLFTAEWIVSGGRVKLKESYLKTKQRSINKMWWCRQIIHLTYSKIKRRTSMHKVLSVQSVFSPSHSFTTLVRIRADAMAKQMQWQNRLPESSRLTNSFRSLFINLGIDNFVSGLYSDSSAMLFFHLTTFFLHV